MKIISRVALVCVLVSIKAHAAVETYTATDQAYVTVHNRSFTINNVRLVDGTGANSLSGATVVVENGRIVFAGERNSAPILDGSTVIDGTGKSLLPGFVMMHEHLFYPDGKGDYTQFAEAFSRLYLAGGATTIRTAGSIDPYIDLAVAKAIRAGKQPGPEIDVTGPFLDGQPKAVARMPTIDDPEDAKRTVEYWAEEGATSFKVYEHTTLGDLKEIISEAHKRELKVTGHICSITYAQAIAAGIDNLEHSFAEPSDFVANRQEGTCPPWPERLKSLIELDVDGQEYADLIDLIIENGVALTSTLAIMETLSQGRPTLEDYPLSLLSPEFRESFLEMRSKVVETPFGQLAAAMLNRLMKLELKFYRQGGHLMAGSDPTGFGGVIPGFSASRQFVLMVESGFSVPEVVNIMSLKGAIYLENDHKIGSVEVGKNADLILVNGDVISDPDSINNIETVFKDGVGFNSAAIIETYIQKIGAGM